MSAASPLAPTARVDDADRAHPCRPGRRLRATLLPSRDDLVDLGFTVLLVGLALWGLRTVFFGWEWILAAVGGLLLGLLVAHLVTAFRLPSVVTLLGLAAAYLVFGGPLAVRDHLALGVFPTGRTFRDLASAAVHGWKRLLTLLPPVDATVSLLALPLIVGLVAAAVTYTVARRTGRGYAVVVPPLAALGLTIVLGTLEPASLVAQGVVFGLGAIGWMIVRSTRSRAPLQNGAGATRGWGSAPGCWRWPPSPGWLRVRTCLAPTVTCAAWRAPRSYRPSTSRSSRARWPGTASTPSPTRPSCTTPS